MLKFLLVEKRLSITVMKLHDVKIRIIFFLRFLLEFGFVEEKKVLSKEFGDFRGNIVDIGCGIGNFSSCFPHARYTGVDIDPNLIDYAKRNYRGIFLARPGEETGLETNSFKGVFTIGLFHHVDKKTVEAICREIQRVVKPGGIIVVIEDDRPETGVRRMLFSLDAGGKFRAPDYFGNVFSRFFTIQKTYRIYPGFWRYTVFVMRTPRGSRLGAKSENLRIPRTK